MKKLLNRLFDRSLNHFNLQKLGWIAGRKKYLHGERDTFKYKDKEYYIDNYLYSFNKNIFYIHNGKDMEENEQYFQGVILNIQELKKLMLQIGIK